MVVAILDKKKWGERKVKYTLEVDAEEVRNLQGHLQGIYFFSPDTPGLPTSVVETGIKGSTKYFEIPKEYLVKKSRKRGFPTAQGSLPISCQRFSKGSKDIFIYVLKKA